MALNGGNKLGLVGLTPTKEKQKCFFLFCLWLNLKLKNYSVTSINIKKNNNPD
jgi:hypothetical protein